MTTTQITPTPVAARARRDLRSRPGAPGSIGRTTVVAGITAAAATTTTAAIARSAGVSFDVHGQIPLPGFATVTLLCAGLGALLAVACRRMTTRPRRRFVQLAVVLTAVSCVVPLAYASTATTTMTLVATHLLAAAILIPALARCFGAGRN